MLCNGSGTPLSKYPAVAQHYASWGFVVIGTEEKNAWNAFGAINAITDTKHSSTYKTAVALSPTNKELAHNLFWDYDATKIKIPIMLISGAGGGDDWVVTGEQLQGDEEAGKAFTGDSPEIMNNPLYQDQMADIQG